jgi:multidrug efflux system outer membrane protein
MLKYFAIIAAMVILAGCAVHSPEPRSGSPLPLPDKYALYSSGEKGPGMWWKAFESDELNRLVTVALAGNFDLKSAYARLRKAQALFEKTGANKYPKLDMDAKGSVQERRAESSSTGRNVTTDSESWSLGAAASYEVDLWGRLGSERRADALSARAAKEDLEAAAVTVAASVTKTWVNILALRHEITILKEQIQASQSLLELLTLRFQNGKSSALDVSQQQESLASLRADLPLKQLQVATLVNSLALLLGKASAQDIQVRESRLPSLIPLPASGLPAELLAARPDVRAAGLRVGSADWDVVTARASRLPKLNLSAGAALNAASTSLLFDNWLLSLAANLTAPLFDGGQRAAEVARTRAVAEEKLSDYAKTVAQAVKEVEDNLVSEARQQEYLVLLKEQLEAARITLKNAQLQYQNGQSEYRNYLSGWTSVQLLERKLVTQKAALINYRVDLYRALGGDWSGRLADGVVGDQKKK